MQTAGAVYLIQRWARKHRAHDVSADLIQVGWLSLIARGTTGGVGKAQSAYLAHARVPRA